MIKIILIFSLLEGMRSEEENFLDGCRHVFLDMGTNTGVQIRKLYEPHLFPNASVLPIFDKFFGPIGERDLQSICTVGFEPNVMHNEELVKLEERYQDCGWQVYIALATGVGIEEKSDLEFVYKKVWPGERPGEALTDPLGGMGRFLDDGNYAKDIVEGTMFNVRQIRIADFIKGVVATRRFERDPNSPNKYPPAVVMKLDVEGRYFLFSHFRGFPSIFKRELGIVPDLVMSGALQHIDNLHVDWTKDDWTDESLVNQLSAAMSVLTTLGTERGLAHITEVVPLDDESYSDFKGPLPQCSAVQCSAG